VLAYRPKIEAAKSDFDNGVDELLRVFGADVARKPTSGQFNRAIFDALIFFHSQPHVRTVETVRECWTQLQADVTGCTRCMEFKFVQKCRKKAISGRYLRTALTDGGIKELNRR
jgi:hypothetical protein